MASLAVKHLKKNFNSFSNNRASHYSLLRSLIVVHAAHTILYSVINFSKNMCLVLEWIVLSTDEQQQEEEAADEGKKEITLHVAHIEEN